MYGDNMYEKGAITPKMRKKKKIYAVP